MENILAVSKSVVLTAVISISIFFFFFGFYLYGVKGIILYIVTIRRKCAPLNYSRL